MVDKNSATNGNGNEEEESIVRTLNTGVTALTVNDQQGNNGSITEETSQQVPEELTLTDHLNKRLLEAFLVRINNNSTQQEQQIASNNDGGHQSDWVDQ